MTVGTRNSAASTVRQRLHFVGREAGKLLALRQLIREGLTPPVLVFVASKVCQHSHNLTPHCAVRGAFDVMLMRPVGLNIARPCLLPPPQDRAKALHRELMYDGVHVDSIHAEQSHAARTAAVDNFRLGRTWLLVATDLIGRGMDFIGVKTVVNYDFPASTADYIHRVGRTGRAGNEGVCVLQSTGLP